jgi:hypothetical protein
MSKPALFFHGRKIDQAFENIFNIVSYSEHTSLSSSQMLNTNTLCVLQLKGILRHCYHCVVKSTWI